MTEHSHALSSLVFAQWDFGMAKPKGIKTQQVEIKTNLKLLLATGVQTSADRKLWAIMVNLIVLATLAGFLTLIFYVTSSFVPQLQTEYCTSTDPAENEDSM